MSVADTPRCGLSVCFRVVFSYFSNDRILALAWQEGQLSNSCCHPLCVCVLRMAFRPLRFKGRKRKRQFCKNERHHAGRATQARAARAATKVMTGLSGRFSLTIIEKVIISLSPRRQLDNGKVTWTGACGLGRRRRGWGERFPYQLVLSFPCESIILFLDLHRQKRINYN